MVLRAAVIGVGSMGRNHARVYAEMEDIELVAIADTDEAVARNVAGLYHARAYVDHRTMLEQEDLDLVSIAVPTRYHAVVARDVICTGLPMLIEKPIAMTVEEAEVIIECARERGVVLAVGHIERFNPAVIKLKSCLGQGVLGRVFQIHARRLGPFPNRIEDVGVTIDLATHDLDIICYLTGAKVERVYAELGFRANGQHEDVLSAVLWFSDGTIGGLDVNWLTPTKVRELIVVGERGMFVLNYVTQDLFFYANRLENPSPQGHGASQGSAGTEGTRYCAGWQEPLRLELEAFAAAVRGETNLVVTGHEGLRALILAEAMLQAGGKHAVITL